MTAQQGSPSRLVPAWFVLVVAIAALVISAVALTATLLQGPGTGWWGLMGGPGMMGRGPVSGPGMMGRFYAGQVGSQVGPQPGQPGFVAGTTAQPRIVGVWAGPGYAFTPSTISVAQGETVTFEVTVMGPIGHEFMVGPADAVAGDVAGTPEIDGLGMMQTSSLTYTFDGSGPYAYACHAPGHYEAGMRGTITVVPS